VSLDPYAQLGVPRDADDATIKKAWRRKARECHPDRNPDDPHATTKMQLVQEAYEILSDPERRARYDNDGDGAKHIDTTEQRAAALLAGTIVQVLKQADAQGALEHPDFQVIQALHDALDQMRAGAIKRKADCDRVRRGLERQLKRFKHVGKGENLIGDVMAEQMKRAKTQAEKNALDVEEITAALNMLEAYVDLPPEDLFTVAQQRFANLLGQHPGLGTAGFTVTT